MNRIILIMLMMIVWLNLRAFQADRDTTETLHYRLKMGINKAAHDASMQIDDDEWGQGRIVFDRPKSLSVFKETLAANMDLKNDLTPVSGALLRDPVEIIFQDYMDDSSGLSFPVTYENEAYGIYKVLKGPAVIYRVRTKLPQRSHWTYKGYVYKTVIFEYPYP